MKIARTAATSAATAVGFDSPETNTPLTCYRTSDDANVPNDNNIINIATNFYQA